MATLSEIVKAWRAGYREYRCTRRSLRRIAGPNGQVASRLVLARTAEDALAIMRKEFPGDNEGIDIEEVK